MFHDIVKQKRNFYLEIIFKQKNETVLNIVDNLI